MISHNKTPYDHLQQHSKLFYFHYSKKGRTLHIHITLGCVLLKEHWLQCQPLYWQTSGTWFLVNILFVNVSAETEIGNFNCFIRANQDISGGQVTMHDFIVGQKFLCEKFHIDKMLDNNFVKFISHQMHGASLIHYHSKCYLPCKIQQINARQYSSFCCFRFIFTCTISHLLNWFAINSDIILGRHRNTIATILNK